MLIKTERLDISHLISEKTIMKSGTASIQIIMERDMLEKVMWHYLIV